MIKHKMPFAISHPSATFKYLCTKMCVREKKTYRDIYTSIKSAFIIYSILEAILFAISAEVFNPKNWAWWNRQFWSGLFSSWFFFLILLHRFKCTIYNLNSGTVNFNFRNRPNLVFNFTCMYFTHMRVSSRAYQMVILCLAFE